MQIENIVWLDIVDLYLPFALLQSHTPAYIKKKKNRHKTRGWYIVSRIQ